ncbi:Bacteriophage Mu Gam like protein, partial [Haemophilus influenzae]
GRSEQRSHVK